MAKIPAQEVIAKLRRAITTASNDDFSLVGSEKRQRHIERIDIMNEAIEWIEAKE